MYKWSWSHKIAAGSAKCSSECMKCVTTSPPWPVPQLGLFTASATKPTNILGSSIWLLGSETKRSISKYWADFEQRGPTVDNLNIVDLLANFKQPRSNVKSPKICIFSNVLHLWSVPSSLKFKYSFFLYNISRVHVPRGGHVFSSDCRKLNSKFKNSNSSAHVAMWFARTAAPMCQHVHR